MIFRKARSFLFSFTLSRQESGRFEHCYYPARSYPFFSFFVRQSHLNCHCQPTHLTSLLAHNVNYTSRVPPDFRARGAGRSCWTCRFRQKSCSAGKGDRSRGLDLVQGRLPENGGAYCSSAGTKMQVTRAANALPTEYSPPPHAFFLLSR